jgi:hypothetical protein
MKMKNFKPIRAMRIYESVSEVQKVFIERSILSTVER